MNVSDMFTYVKSSEGKIICTSFVYESSLDLCLAPNVSVCLRMQYLKDKWDAEKFAEDLFLPLCLPSYRLNVKKSQATSITQ